MRAESDAKQELVGADGAERRDHKDTWTRFLTVRRVAHIQQHVAPLLNYEIAIRCVRCCHTRERPRGHFVTIKTPSPRAHVALMERTAAKHTRPLCLSKWRDGAPF